VFLQELQQLGWADGPNVRIDYRFALGDPEWKDHKRGLEAGQRKKVRRR
jgi:hypothetical protein